VHADFLPTPFRTVPAAGVRRIVVLLCDGDDHGTIASNIDTPSLSDGGEGDDMINGGRGSVMIGGAGADRLVGGPGDDVLVAGAVALADVLRVAAGTLPLSAGLIHADRAADMLTGGSGRDRYFANLVSAASGDVLDSITDRKPDESVLETV
jgi:Ca2+-binding RTX toxin-like protein